ncbi:MAG: BatA domain-containing protein [Balneolaceae bacterium]|nr:BatA domain-containing protein [Balneolaceae bacterium]
MNFLNPFFLLGALAVAIPVVIHLINLRRPKKMRFSTLTFFEELKKSTIRRIRIKQYLLLALRVAAVLMLAIALARPLLTPSVGGNASSDEPRVVAVLIDNSPSMSRIGAGGPFLEQAKQIARRIVEGAGSSDRFVVTTTNNTGSGMQLANAARSIDQIDEIELSNTGNRILPAVRLIKNQLQNSTMNQAMVYLITDGQKSQLDDLEALEGEPSDDAKQIGIQILRVGSTSQPNLAVSDIELQSKMLSRGNPVTVQAEVKNYGTAGAANQFVSLEVGDRMVGQYEINLDPGASRELVFEIVPETAGDISGKVVIEGDEISFDNERYFVIGIPGRRSVLLVNEESSDGSQFISYLQPALEAARRSNTQIEFERVRPEEVDQSNWLQHDVIILDGLNEIPEYWFADLQRYVQNGKGVLFFPSEQGDIRNYNRFLDQFNAGAFTGIQGEYGTFKPVAQLGRLVEGHPIMDEMFVRNENENEERGEIQVDLPELFFYYRFEPASSTGSFTILSSSIDDEILQEQRFGEGQILVSTLGTDPGWSNFPVNTLFAPLFYRAVLYASSSEQGGLKEHTLDEERFTWTGEIDSRSLELHLGDVTYRPEVQTVPDGVRVSYAGREWEPGILRIRSEQEERLVAVNQHISESDFQTLGEEELENILDNSLTVTGMLDANELSEQDLIAQVRTASVGREVWNWFIWTALLLLVAETLISKLYRAESIA